MKKSSFKTQSVTSADFYHLKVDPKGLVRAYDRHINNNRAYEETTTINECILLTCIACLSKPDISIY